MPEINKPIFAALVLAAGSSRRFGSDKRLFNIDGSTLLQRSLSIPIELGIVTTVVLKPSDKPLVQPLLGRYSDHPLLNIVFAEDAVLGMGHSLSAGIRSILQCSECIDGVLVFLADMPSLKVTTIKELIKHFSNDKIVVPTQISNDKKLKTGHPVLFGRGWLKELRELNGDSGAKELIRRNLQDIIKVPVDDDGIFLDIDRPEESHRTHPEVSSQK